MLSLWPFRLVMSGDAPMPMTKFEIELPEHVLHFALPEEYVRAMTPAHVASEFDPSSPSFDQAGFERAGFRSIAGTLYQFKGPFWVGIVGVLSFDLIVNKRSDLYGDQIETVAGLQKYIERWISAGEYAGRFAIDRTTLNGRLVVRRAWNTFGNPEDPRPEEREIYSFPLGGEMYLEAIFNVGDWRPDRRDSWKPRAEKLREAIKASIVLEPKSFNSGGQNSGNQ